MRRVCGRLWRTGLAFCLSLSLLSTCGCWSGRELTDLAVVMGVGLDRSDRPGEILVTAQTAKAADMGKKEGGGGPAYWNVSQSGPDPLSALRGMTDTAGRQPYLSHNQIVIFGRELAEEGIQSHLDYFLRDRESRTNVFVAVADGSAAELLDFSPPLDPLPARQLSSQIKARQDTGEWPTVDLLAFANQLMERSRAPLAPLLCLVGEGEEKTAQIMGTAVFREDKMAGVLTQTETRGMLWCLGKVDGAVLEVPLEDGRAGVEIISAAGHIEPVCEQDGSILMRVRVEAEGHMSAQGGDDNLSAPEEIDRLEAALGRTIQTEIEASFQKSQALHTDIYGLGNLIHRQYPARWRELEEDWREVFQGVRLEIRVDPRVSNTGRLTQPAFPKE